MRHSLLALALCAGVALAADTDGLVGRWKFDEGKGTEAADSSGLGNNGVLHGKVVWTAGVSGGALEFNGKDTWVQVPASKSLDLKAATLSAWVQMEQIGGILCFSTGGGWKDERAVLHFYDGGPKRSGRLCFTVGDGKRWPTVATRTPIPLDKWVHLAATCDGKGMRIYVDGVLATPPYKTKTTPNTKDVAFKIGRTEGLNPDFFMGKIDEVRVYSRALSPEEIKKLATEHAGK